MSPALHGWEDDEPLEEVSCSEAMERYALSPFQLQRLVGIKAVRRPWIDGRPTIVVTPGSHLAMREAGTPDPRIARV